MRVRRLTLTGAVIVCLLLGLFSRAPGEEGNNVPVPPRLAEARRLLEEGDGAGALIRVEAMLARAPTNRRALELAGYIHYTAGHLEKASLCFRRALVEDPCSAYSLIMLGNVAFQEFRYHEALDFYRRALPMAPSDALLERNVLLVQQGIERARRAARCYRRGSIFFWIGLVTGSVCFLLLFVLHVRDDKGWNGAGPVG